MDSELPQWISYVGGAIGIIIASVIVRLGWMKGGQDINGKPETARVMGALVDSKAVYALQEALEDHTHVLGDLGEKLTREMRVLSDEVRHLANREK